MHVLSPPQASLPLGFEPGYTLYAAPAFDPITTPDQRRHGGHNAMGRRSACDTPAQP